MGWLIAIMIGAGVGAFVAEHYGIGAFFLTWALLLVWLTWMLYRAPECPWHD